MKAERKLVPIGPQLIDKKRWSFSVWAPRHEKVELHLRDVNDRTIEMNSQANGYFQITVEELAPGARYCFRLGEREFPDPASRFQPDGVHGPSAVVDPRFDWTDGGWSGIPLAKYI